MTLTRTVLRHITASGHHWLIDPCPTHGAGCPESRWVADPQGCPACERGGV